MFADRTSWNLEPNPLNRALMRLRATGKPLLDLTQSNPTECGFVYDVGAILSALAEGQALRYEPDPRGLKTTRDAISSYYAEQRIPVTCDDLLLTSGTSEAYSFVFRLLCNTGDEILIPSPSYPLFDFLAELCDVKLVRYPLLYDHAWQIDFSALSASASRRTRAVVAVHPNNPTGHYTSGAEQQRLTAFCAERGIALIADEVFLDFSSNGSPQKSFALFDDAMTFTLSGISKTCGLPQMKLAWIVINGPAEQKRAALARLEVIADAYLSVGTPVQLAASTMLATRTSFQAQVMTRIRANLSELNAQLSRQSACNSLSCEGGWSAVLRVPAIHSDEDLAVTLLNQKGVLLHPGHFYDFAQPGHAIISLIVPGQDFAEGIRRTLEHFS
jgi:alanine-synthesizing transaminase